MSINKQNVSFPKFKNQSYKEAVFTLQQFCRELGPHLSNFKKHIQSKANHVVREEKKLNQQIRNGDTAFSQKKYDWVLMQREFINTETNAYNLIAQILEYLPGMVRTIESIYKEGVEGDLELMKASKHNSFSYKSKPKNEEYLLQLLSTHVYLLHLQGQSKANPIQSICLIPQLIDRLKARCQENKDEKTAWLAEEIQLCFSYFIEFYIKLCEELIHDRDAANHYKQSYEFFLSQSMNYAELLTNFQNLTYV